MRPIVRRLDPRLQIMTETLEGLIPGASPAHLTVEVIETLTRSGTQKNTWTGRPAELAERLCTALYGRPRAAREPLSPLQQAEDAKRRRDLVGEVFALNGAHRELTTAPWYPARPGDLVHVHYEAARTQPAYGETYIVLDAGDGLMSMQLLAPRFASGDPNETACVVEAADCPIYELWFEAGPHRLTIVRDGRPVHVGGAQ